MRITNIKITRTTQNKYDMQGFCIGIGSRV